MYQILNYWYITHENLLLGITRTTSFFPNNLGKFGKIFQNR